MSYTAKWFLGLQDVIDKHQYHDEWDDSAHKSYYRALQYTFAQAIISGDY